MVFERSLCYICFQATHDSLFVWAIHRPPKLTFESNIMLLQDHLFYQIIIGFSCDVYMSSGNYQCLFVIQFFISICCQYWPEMRVSLSEQYSQTTKANIRIKHCSSRILSVLSNNYWFFFWWIHEFWQTVLVCHSILYINVLSILAIHHTLFVWAIQTTRANIRIKHCSSRLLSSVLSNNYWLLFRFFLLFISGFIN